jgi:hypothetical protein
MATESSETYLSQREAAEALGVTEREVQRRMRAGELHWKSFPSERHRGKFLKRIAFSSLAGDAQQRHAARLLLPLPTLDADAKPMEALAVIPPSSIVNHPSKIVPASIDQLALPLDRAELFRLLPERQRSYVLEWFQRLNQFDLLHWDGDWRGKFGGKELRVQHPGESSARVFFIDSKTDLFEYAAALYQLPVRTLYRRRGELLSFFAYCEDCRKRGVAVDPGIVNEIFPCRTREAGESFRVRADAGVSRAVSSEVEAWLLARMARGARPGEDGWKAHAATMYRELQETIEFLEFTGEDPAARGYVLPSLCVFRRLVRRFQSRPALVFARQGSTAFHDQVDPLLRRETESLWVHDWWVSDHRQANVWVYLEEDPAVVFRPWTTWWMDVRSRWPVSVVGALVPSSLTIMRAWKIALLRYRVAPRFAYTDNGADYQAQVLNGPTPEGGPGPQAGPPLEASTRLNERELGMWERFGTTPRHALPARRNKRTGEQESHARSKLIESFFGNNLDEFDRQQPGACGEGPDSKPDKLFAEIGARHQSFLDGKAPPLLLSLSEYLARLEAMLCSRHYGQRRHSSLGISPLEAFQRYTRTAAGLPERLLAPEEIDALMLTPPVSKKVAHMSVSLQLSGKTEYFEHAGFYALHGESVEVSVDPSDPCGAYIWQRGRFLFFAPRVVKLAYGAPQEKIGERMKLQRYVLRQAKDEVKQLQAAAPVLDQGQLAIVRQVLAGGQAAAVPHAISLERRRKALQREPEGPRFSSDVAARAAKLEEQS